MTPKPKKPKCDHLLGYDILPNAPYLVSLVHNRDGYFPNNKFKWCPNCGAKNK